MHQYAVVYRNGGYKVPFMRILSQMPQGIQTNQILSNLKAIRNTNFNKRVMPHDRYSKITLLKLNYPIF